MAFSPDGKALATGSWDGTVRLWPTARGETDLRRPSGQWPVVYVMAASADGKRLAFNGPNDTIRVWDLTAMREVASLKVGWFSFLYPVMSPDGKLLAIGTDSDREAVKVWDVERGRVVATLPRDTRGVLPFFRRSLVAFSPNGRLLARSGEGNRIKLWDVIARRDVGELAASRDVAGLGVMAFSPDSKLLAACGRGSVVKLWDLATRREIYSFPGAKNWSGPPVFSPDGKLLATGTGDYNTVQIWDLATKRRLTTLKGHTAQVSRIEFAPDGRSLVTFSEDRTIRFWSVASWQEAVALRDPQLIAQAVTFAGQDTLITGRADGSMRLYRAVSPAEVNIRNGGPRSGETH